nr:hypothetical protein [uncultured Desulfobacter sp.]
MSLINFGSILAFAEELENQQFEFCNTAMGLPQCSDLKSVLQPLGKSAQKRVAEVRRVRRENVTEMILETLEGFSREPFVLRVPDPFTLPPKKIKSAIIRMGNRAADYYEKAADTLKGQAEAARALKSLKKKHIKDLKLFKTAID